MNDLTYSDFEERDDAHNPGTPREGQEIENGAGNPEPLRTAASNPEPEAQKPDDQDIEPPSPEPLSGEGGEEAAEPNKDQPGDQDPAADDGAQADHPPEAPPVPRSLADLVLALVLEEIDELWYDQNDLVFGTVRVNGHLEHLPLDGAFKHYVKMLWWVHRRTRLSPSVLDEVIGTLEAMARFEGTKQRSYVRVGHHGGNVYVDLCNDNWSAVEIHKDGFRVIDRAPVRFVRYNGMEALPLPTAENDAHKLGMLQTLLNLPEDGGATFKLLLGFIVAAYNPSGTYLQMMVYGPQGSGKTTLTRVIRALVDPSDVPVQAPPRSQHDLILTANNSFLPAFDNMSEVKPWMSDELCRLSTGNAFKTRRYYTVRDEETFEMARPAILNGITNVIVQNDLIDRSIFINLHGITPDERRTSAELKRKFGEHYAELFGAVCAAVSSALRNVDQVRLDRLPRMADIARWIHAAEEVLPVEQGAFKRAYEQNQQQAAEESVEQDVVAAAVLDMMGEVEEWSGSMTELLDRLATGSVFSGNSARFRNMQPRGLQSALLRSKPALERMGIEVDYNPQRKDKRRRTKVIIRRMETSKSLFSEK